MTKIALGSEGKFLSGRSRAAELVHRLPKNGVNSPLVLDFSGVEWVTQSFVSEFLVHLREIGVRLDQVELTGMTNPEMETHVRKEMKRLNELFALKAFA